jgi:copper chaperone CopZ
MLMQVRVTRCVLLVIGMRNNECRERICNALRQVQGVKDVNVSLIRAQAMVLYEPPCEAAALTDAVVAAGYGATVE